MSKKMINAKTIANYWGITQRRVVQLCNEGLIKDAVKISGIWNIPVDTPKPDIVRIKKNTVTNKTKRILPCPVGITSYKEVSTECYYVDKTLLIKDIIDDHSKVTLFTRPRRFGKTLAMDMLKTFFEKTNEDTSIYFEDKLIFSQGDYYKSFQGKYPVIFLSFKDVNQKTWKDMHESLLITISDEYKRHMELLDNELINNLDKKYYLKLIEGNVSDVELQLSLGQLSRMLSIAYNSRVIVIIDEFDTPIQQGKNNGYYDEVVFFIRNLFSAILKDNNNLEFGILTGILRIAKESLFSGLNNIIVNTILDEKYSQYFGFTNDDVEKLVSYYGKEEKINELRKWYDGYLFGNMEIFNPWSVINYINNNCVPKAFWCRTSSNDIVLKILGKGNLNIQESLYKLLRGKSISSFIDTDITYSEVGNKKDNIYSFLLMTGYLKIQRIIDSGMDNPLCELVIPNKEIESVFKKGIIDNLSVNIASSIITDFQMALKICDAFGVQKSLSKYLENAVSYFDTTSENFYHGMMLGLLAIMSDDYIIKSNRESGEGRYDVELIPVNKCLPGIILELKSVRDADNNKLEKLADEAIRQIKEKKYDNELKINGISKVLLFGIAFCKKNVWVKTIEAD